MNAKAALPAVRPRPQASARSANAAPAKRPALAWAIPFLTVGAAVAWSYWTVITDLVAQWGNDPNYSAGQLVPLVAAYLAWVRLREAPVADPRPCWWGLGLLGAAQLVRLAGMVLLYESFERYALVLTIWGLVLLVSGTRVFWRLRWVLVLLVLMVPFPGRVHNLIAGPLQGLATATTMHALELAGVTVDRSGNLIKLNDEVTVGVVEACSGLRMLTAFIIVAAAFAFLVDRPAWQRAVLVMSSVPIAIVCNAIRLLVTALLYMAGTAEAAEIFFHDFAGLCMMPLALGFLMLELWLLDRLLLPPPDDAPRDALAASGLASQRSA